MAFEETPQEPAIRLVKKLVSSIIGGIAFTLATLLLPNNALIGTSAYGYPFAWFSQPLYPVESPPSILWNGLILDIIVWTIVVFLIILGYRLLRNTKKT